MEREKERERESGREWGGRRRRRDPALITNAQALIKTDNKDFDNNQAT